MKRKLLLLLLMSLLAFTSFCKKKKDDNLMKLGLIAYAMQQPSSSNFTLHIEVKDSYSSVIPNARVQTNSASINIAKVLETTKEQKQTINASKDITDANGIIQISLPAGAHSLVVLDASGNVKGTFAIAIRETGMVMLSNEKSVKVRLAYTIGGTVTGLSGTLVLQNNATDDLTLTGDGAYTFSNGLVTGSAYSVTVKTQPTGQTCTATNASGTLTAYKTDVAITCISSTTVTIGGTIGGTLTGMVLQNNGADDLAVQSGAGTFTFTTTTPAYNITIKTQPTSPTGANCTVVNGSGIANANVTNISISCTCATAATYSWGTFNDRCNGTIEFAGTAGTFGGNVYETKTLYYAKCSQGQTWNSTTNACDGTATSTIPFCSAADNTCNGGNNTGSLISGTSHTSCDALNTTPSGGFAGKTGWRTPNRNESKLMVLCGASTIPNESVACASSTAPAVNTTLFPSTPTGNFWSRESSTAADAWYFSTTNGITNALAKNTNAYLRCITDGATNYPSIVGKFRSIVSTPTGDAVYAVGYFEGTGTYSYGNNVTVTGFHATKNPVLVKYNSSGVAQWAKTFTSVPTGGSGDFHGVALDSSGNIYVAGESKSASGTYSFGNSISNSRYKIKGPKIMFFEKRTGTNIDFFNRKERNLD